MLIALPGFVLPPGGPGRITVQDRHLQELLGGLLDVALVAQRQGEFRLRLGRGGAGGGGEALAQRVARRVELALQAVEAPEAEPRLGDRRRVLRAVGVDRLERGPGGVVLLQPRLRPPQQHQRLRQARRVAVLRREGRQQRGRALVVAPGQQEPGGLHAGIGGNGRIAGPGHSLLELLQRALRVVLLEQRPGQLVATLVSEIVGGEQLQELPVQRLGLGVLLLVEALLGRGQQALRGLLGHRGLRVLAGHGGEGLGRAGIIIRQLDLRQAQLRQRRGRAVPRQLQRVVVALRGRGGLLRLQIRLPQRHERPGARLGRDAGLGQVFHQLAGLVEFPLSRQQRHQRGARQPRRLGALTLVQRPSVQCLGRRAVAQLLLAGGLQV